MLWDCEPAACDERDGSRSWLPTAATHGRPSSGVGGTHCGGEPSAGAASGGAAPPDWRSLVWCGAAHDVSHCCAGREGTLLSCEGSCVVLRLVSTGQLLLRMPFPLPGASVGTVLRSAQFDTSSGLLLTLSDDMSSHMPTGHIRLHDALGSRGGGAAEPLPLEHSVSSDSDHVLTCSLSTGGEWVLALVWNARLSALSLTAVRRCHGG